MNEITSQALLTATEQANSGFSFSGTEIDPMMTTVAQNSDFLTFLRLGNSHHISEFIPMLAGLDDAKIIVF